MKAIKEEPETIRRKVLGYMGVVVLGEGDAYLPACIIEEFEKSYYESGKVGLYLSVYRSCLIKRRESS